MTSSAVKGSTYLSIQGVIDLGHALIKTADKYPIKFITERDFFPLVVTYLTGRVPGLETEASTDGGRIDFQLKGTNPTWLELALQPRRFVDGNFPGVRLPGYACSSLRADQNRPEMRKLMREPKGKTRYLLLVDLNGGYVESKLKGGYQTEARRSVGGKSVRVVYVSRNRTFTFKAGAKTKKN